MSLLDYDKLLRKGRERRGVCLECGDETCSCKKASVKTAESYADEAMGDFKQVNRLRTSPQDFLDYHAKRNPEFRHALITKMFYAAHADDFEGADKVRSQIHSLMDAEGVPAPKDWAHYKTADIDPNIRSSVDDSKPNGLDVQQPLLRNPYSTGTAGDPKSAMDFENGYQYAQSLGHQQLNQIGPQHAASWATRSKPWRDGFAQAARGMGCGNVAAQMDASNKIAQHRTTIMIPNFPISVNFKIASALGTLAGGLAGAALGAGAGHAIGEHAASEYDLHPFGTHNVSADDLANLRIERSADSLTDPLTGEITRGPSDGMLEQLYHAQMQHEPAISHMPSPHEYGFMDRNFTPNEQTGVAGAGLGAAAGGAAGAALGHHFSKQPYPSMGAPKLAMAYFQAIKKK